MACLFGLMSERSTGPVTSSWGTFHLSHWLILPSLTDLGKDIFYFNQGGTSCITKRSSLGWQSRKVKISEHWPPRGITCLVQDFEEIIVCQLDIRDFIGDGDASNVGNRLRQSQRATFFKCRLGVKPSPALSIKCEWFAPHPIQRISSIVKFLLYVIGPYFSVIFGVWHGALASSVNLRLIGRVGPKVWK